MHSAAQLRKLDLIPCVVELIPMRRKSIKQARTDFFDKRRQLMAAWGEFLAGPGAL